MTALEYARNVIEDYDNDGDNYSMSEAVDAMREAVLAYDITHRDLEALRSGSIASAREPTLVVTVNVTAPLCDPEQLSQTIKQALDPELRKLAAEQTAATKQPYEPGQYNTGFIPYSK